MADLEQALIPPDLEFDVECDGLTHPIRVLGGHVHQRQHPVEESVLEALGGEPPSCMRWIGMIKRAPVTLTMYEMCLLTGIPAAALGSVVSMAGRRNGEPAVDAEEVPRTIRRLAALSSTWNNSIGQRRNLTRSQTLTFATRAFDHAAKIDLTVGPAPTVENGVATLAFDWLATVFVLGLERFAGAATIGSRFQGQWIVLTQFEQDRAVERRVAMSEAAPGFRLLQDARA